MNSINAMFNALSTERNSVMKDMIHYIKNYQYKLCQCTIANVNENVVNMLSLQAQVAFHVIGIDIFSLISLFFIVRQTWSPDHKSSVEILCIVA